MYWSEDSIGIVFNQDVLGHGYRAARLFFEAVDPARLKIASIYEGDTSATLTGKHNQYCIAASDVDVDYLKSAFEYLQTPGLAPFEERFLQGHLLQAQQLIYTGFVDLFGRLVTEEWNRLEHDLCLAAGWGYDPRLVTCSLTPDLKQQLAELRDRLR